MAKRIDKRPGTFAIDLSKAPYTVPCPVCRAFALAPCRSEPRPVPTLLDRGKPTGRVLPLPHPERWSHWKRNPKYRVQVVG